MGRKKCLPLTPAMQLVASTSSTREKSDVAHNLAARIRLLTSRFSHMISEGCGASLTLILTDPRNAAAG